MRFKPGPVPRIEEYCARPAGEERKFGGRRVGCSLSERGRDVVSVITVCYNAASTLRQTILSVAAQSYDLVEYIVIDGGSTDGTLDLLRSHEDSIDIWISERDAGISDAFNKGISLARGEFVILVNADDWLEQDHLRIAVAALRKPHLDYVFGNLVLHGPEGGVVGTYIGDGSYKRVIRHVMPVINHPTVVCRRQAYERFGLFDLSLHCAMDYEWFLRVHILGGQGAYVADLVSHMSIAGRSDRMFVRSLAEVREASIAYGYSFLLAWLRFCFRVAKGSTRRGLEMLLPSRAYYGLRGVVNARFRGHAG